MGKASILADLGDGEYSVMLRRERTRIVAQLARLATENTEIDALIVEKEAQQPVLLAEMEAARAALNAAIAALPSPPAEADLEAIKAVTETFRTARLRYQVLVDETAFLKLRRTANDKMIAKLNNQPDDEALTLWCADYSEGLSGDVGVIDIGLQDQRWGDVIRVIYPDDNDGTPGSAAWINSRDGLFQPILAGTPASVFFNFAMAPGLEKWRPRYRSGVITEIDHGANTCTVALDALTHSSDDKEHETLDLNQSTEVAATIRYMTCNGIAFEVNDLVVVAFEGNDWAHPVVIGFQREPRVCADLRWVATYQNGPDWYSSVINFKTGSGSYLTTDGKVFNPSFKFGDDNCLINNGDIFFAQQKWNINEGIESSSYVYETEVTPKGTYVANGDVQYNEKIFKLYKNRVFLCDLVAQTKRCKLSGGYGVLISCNSTHVFILSKHEEVTWEIYWSFSGGWYPNYTDIPVPHDDNNVTGVEIGVTKRVSSLTKISHVGAVAASKNIFVWETAGTGGTIVDWDVTPYTGNPYEIYAVAANDDLVFVLGLHDPAEGGGDPANMLHVVSLYDTNLSLVNAAWYTESNYATPLNRLTIACGTGFLAFYKPTGTDLNIYSTPGMALVKTITIAFEADVIPPGAVGGVVGYTYTLSCRHDHIVLFKINRYYDGDFDFIHEVQAYQWKITNFNTWAVSSHGLIGRYVVREDVSGQFAWPFIAG